MALAMGKIPAASRIEPMVPATMSNQPRLTSLTASQSRRSRMSSSSTEARLRRTIAASGERRSAVMTRAVPTTDNDTVDDDNRARHRLRALDALLLTLDQRDEFDA